MELSVEQRQYKRLASELRMALVMDDEDHALSAIAAVKPLSEYASAKELTDFVERAAVWSSPKAIDAIFDELGPIPYRGWALALALRCAREDVTEALKARGATLLEDPVVPEDAPGREKLVLDLVRNDLTASSPRLLDDPQGRSVASEIFRPFGPADQLLGSDYARSTSIVATCELVSKIANERTLTDLVFDEVCRSAVACAARAYAFPSSFEPETPEACLSLARTMLALHAQGLGGTDRIEEVLARMIVPRVDERVIAFICECQPSVFYGRLASQSWLREDSALVARMVGRLVPGTEYQNGVLMTVLAQGGRFDELQDILGWDDTFTPANLDRAIDAASEAGHAEIAAWLLTLRQDLADTAAQAKQPEDKPAADDGQDLGDLSDLLL